MDNKIETAFREAAKAGQFPGGLKGRRVRVHRRREFWDATQPEGTKEWKHLLEPWEATVMEAVFQGPGEHVYHGTWEYLLMLDDGKLIGLSVKPEDATLVLIG